MDFTDTHGNPFTYYPHMHLMGFRNRLYYSPKAWRHSLDRFWPQFLSGAMRIRISYVDLSPADSTAFEGCVLGPEFSYGRNDNSTQAYGENHWYWTILELDTVWSATQRNPFTDRINPAFRRAQRCVRKWVARRRERRLAFAMAFHARLGCDSLVATLTVDVVRCIICS